MPEYLAPGVFIEETSYRSKSIEGVGTSTAGFVGPTRTGPISGAPELLTSFADFERIYGGLDDLSFGDDGDMVNYLAHGVRAFFEEGGSRLYVQRIFNSSEEDGLSFDEDGLPENSYGQVAITDGPTLVARFPGISGNMRVNFELRLGQNIYREIEVDGGDNEHVLSRVGDGDMVYVVTEGGDAGDGLYIVEWNPNSLAYQLNDGGGDVDDIDVGRRALADLSGSEAHVVSVVVQIERALPRNRFMNPETLGEYSFNLDTGLTSVFTRNPATRYNALTIPFAIEGVADLAANETSSMIALVQALVDNDFSASVVDDLPETTHTLAGGTDGDAPVAPQYEGIDGGFLDYSGDPLQMAQNGLLAFEAAEDISIVAAPGYSSRAPEEADNMFAVQSALINHCEAMKYRVAVLDTPENFLPTEALDWRNRRSTLYAAMYYPWIIVSDPTPSRGGERLKLPPSAFVAGIYARNDVENAVFKAPANEVVRLAIDFETRINKAQQELLNPNSVNCFRFFEGRGMLLWGARTMTDDSEWKYISVRRYFAYLEYSIDRGTQWAVFENNGPDLWANVRQTIEGFLENEWLAGGLLGDKKEQAYFVRCDRSTMTQNDLDNGRLVCLVGIAPVKPAEFVIFRIGQWTADSNN